MAATALQRNFRFRIWCRESLKKVYILHLYAGWAKKVECFKVNDSVICWRPKPFRVSNCYSGWSRCGVRWLSEHDVIQVTHPPNIMLFSATLAPPTPEILIPADLRSKGRLAPNLGEIVRPVFEILNIGKHFQSSVFQSPYRRLPIYGFFLAKFKENRTCWIRDLLYVAHCERMSTYFRKV